MSGLSSVNREGYSKYERMSTESLAELLRLDIQASEEDALDMEAILYIMEVIEKREKDHPSGLYPIPNVDAAWETFQTKYRPYLTDGRPLYDFDGGDMDEPEQDSTPPPKEGGGRGLRWLGRMFILAAALVIILTISAYAAGYDLWGAIAQWGHDTFTFASESDPSTTGNIDKSVPSNRVEYDSLQEALDAYGITTPLAPTWIPDGFSLEEVVVAESSLDGSISFQAFYIDEDKYLSIYVLALRDNIRTNHSMWEKDDAHTVEIEIGGTTFYLMENDENPVLVWQNGLFESCIYGDVSSEVLISIAKSIYERS